MPVKTPRDLLKHELGDLLYAEKQILKALKPMIRETSDPEMKARLEQHEQETEAQVGNIERAFEAIGEKARPHPRVARLADHLLQPLQDLLLGVQQVAQIVLQELLRIGDGHGFARGSGRGREGQGSCR